MATHAPKLIGVVLAGGQSTRMGKDKASLELQGQSLLERARITLAAISCDDIILSGHLRCGWTGRNLEDQQCGLGPVSGITRVIRWAQDLYKAPTRLLFIPVDTPLLSESLLLHLIGQANGYDGSYVSRSPLPLTLNLNARTLQQAELADLDMTSGSTWSIHRFIQPLCMNTVDHHSINVRDLTNVNSPAEWESLKNEIASLS